MIFTGLDIETTGLNPMTDRIVEIGVSSPTGFRARWLVNPERPIPHEASSIHGIRDAQVKHAPTFIGAWSEAFTAIMRAGAVVVTWNGRAFDLPFINAELRRAGLHALQMDPDTVLDAFLWAKRTPQRWQTNDLGVVASWFGINTGVRHSAADDAHTTALVAEAMRNDGCLPLDMRTALWEQVKRARPSPWSKGSGGPEA